MRRDHRAEVAAAEQFDTPLPTRGKRKWRTRPEDALQVACVKWLRAQPDIRFAVCQPERVKAQIQRRDFLKALGIFGNVGAPEIMIFDGRAMNGRTILVELKAEDGRLSPEQHQWKLWCEVCGFEHAIVRSIEDLQWVVG